MSDPIEKLPERMAPFFQPSVAKGVEGLVFACRGGLSSPSVDFVNRRRGVAAGGCHGIDAGFHDQLNFITGLVLKEILGPEVCLPRSNTGGVLRRGCRGFRGARKRVERENALDARLVSPALNGTSTAASGGGGALAAAMGQGRRPSPCHSDRRASTRTGAVSGTHLLLDPPNLPHNSHSPTQAENGINCACRSQMELCLAVEINLPVAVSLLLVVET